MFVKVAKTHELAEGGVSVACYPRTVSKLQPPWEAINLPSRASP